MSESNSSSLTGYTTFFSLLGLGIVCYALKYLPENALGLSVLCVFALLAEFLSVELFSATRKSRVSISGIFSISGLMIYGPFAGALLGGVVGAATILTHSRPARGANWKDIASWLWRGGFNCGMLAVSTLAAGFVYYYLGGEIGKPAQFDNVVPLVAAVITNELMNVSILLGVLTIQTGQSPLKVWKQSFAWGMPIEIIGGIIGGWALAAAFVIFRVFGLMVFLLPVLLSSYSLRLYMKKSKKYVDELETINRSLDDVNLGLLETLGAVIDAFDIYTYGHSAQVAIYVDAIAEKMKLSKEERSNVVKAALVHDIGKVGITDSIIGKPAPLTEDEYHLVQRHPVIGADIIRRMDGLKDLVPMVRHHHERWDGSGYPAGLAGEEIPQGARIIALADAIDAMVSARPYRRRQSLASVRNELLRCSGTQFDPKLVEEFLTLMNEQGEALLRDSTAPIDVTVSQKSIGDIGITPRYLKKSMLLD